ncbi:MAG TPA: chromosome segregation protein SMC [Anaerohalosphaeraceae bacterium]|nr:chromosome segregation protein SMC [Phycisphaerae bacterium]HOM76525.1 chromosome segregation protein SMC [Anaerohalosphaeraceae bacterium]HPC63908.1 chromosome segregation protein SMC [Anaerohalosphaeraceae bacterium]HPO68664.1 chromosome segregation protein SMC [Anaerohalosphaeraceae bacterium]HRS70830.1 chromosome segregation protein SMC [Anaerohalosphaeraceae bacterium]
MKLEKIIINGFKSFADKTEFSISHPITAIVGPNGCGKSNVVDALKWVLGNQSPKSLRSGQMSDVIFSGSSSRKPSGMAEVTLHFSDVHGLELEQDELQISRRLFRSGESDYLINGKSCRLKDIRELFMDTGIGVSAYSIIEQGQIDQLLKSSTQDRRIIFEEAAGISKYKAHKKEALRKLERTEQNLLRLADIVNEVQKQLRSIKLQAGKARSYLEYSEKLKELRVNYSLAEYDRIVTQQREKNTVLADWKAQFGQTAADLARCDAAVSQLTHAIMETDSQINRWDGILISARSRIEQHHDRIGFLNNRLHELQDRKKNAADQIAKLMEQTCQLASQIKACQKILQEVEQLSETTASRLHQAEQVISTITAQCAELEAQLDDEKSGIIDIVRRTAQLHNEIESLTSYRSTLSGRKTRLSGKAEETQHQLSQWLTEKAQLQAKLEDIRSILSELQSTLEAKRSEMEAIGDQRGRLLEQLAADKEQRSALVSEYNVLSDMEARRQGLNRTLIELLNSESGKRPYIEGIVADVINAEPMYAPAVEAALEGLTDALLVNSTGDFLNDHSLQEKLDGRIRVICMDRIPPFCDASDLSQEQGVLGRMVEFVRYEGRFGPLVWNLLGHIVLVESLDAAVRLWREFGGRFRFVTPAGQVFSGGCMLNIGPLGKKTGLISRKSRLVQLQAELDELSCRIRDKEAALEEQEHKNEHLSGLCQELRTSIYEANTERVDAEARLRVLDDNICRVKQEQPVITGEIEQLEEEIQQSVQREHLSRQKLEELEQINQQRSEHIRLLTSRVEQQRQLQRQHDAELTNLKVQAGQIQEQRKAVSQQIASLQSQLHHTRMAIESARTEALACEEQTVQTQRTLLAAESRLSDLYLEKEQAGRHSIELHRQHQQLSAQQEQNQEELRVHQARQSEIEQQIHQLELELSQLAVKEEDLTLRVREELQIELADAYENYRQENIDWEQVRQQIADLRSKIERLGNVNVDAIDQQKDLEERSQFLTAQVEDLHQSKHQLEDLIERINKESREKFALTFEQIRQNFQQLFRKLFGGGKADILLETPEDILESGIEIIARPPGKETRTISLLSGGEKTMTAIALLFAVFQSKPSPFCVLDEVDAALDEANNERFNLIVQEFKKQSQFIIITHSKRTMSIADILYGITMQTQGVSKKISVTFEEAQRDTKAAVA